MESLQYNMLTLFFSIPLLVSSTKPETQLLKGKFTAQLSSAHPTHQIETLRWELKSFKNTVKNSMKEMEEKVLSLQNGGKLSRSAVYTRWGKKSCPPKAELVFSGYVGGSYYSDEGAAVNPICLPKDPEWGLYNDRVENWAAYIYGAEYETVTLHDSRAKLHNHNVPCAVCLLRDKSVARVFPARKSCYKGWRLEYDGYLMAGYHKHKAGTLYKCVDKDPDTAPGFKSSTNQDGYLFYAVEARCGSLNCPPYTEGRELTCSVCSTP